MPDRSFYSKRGLSFGYNNCAQCAVRIPRRQSQPVCRCCAADTDPNHPEVGADTDFSSELMAPAPEWSITGLSRFPQMESARLCLPDGAQVAAALWWLPKGSRWVAQHPLEYPRNRLKSLPGRDTDAAT
jgi:hypothetical protein